MNGGAVMGIMDEDDAVMSGDPMDDMENEEIERQEKEKRDRIIESLTTAITAMRDEAVKGRAASGIEDEWREDEEHYEGIDAANRSEEARKALSLSGSVRLSGGADTKDTKNRSTIFLNITRPYVDAGSARVSDMLLPTDDRNWAIRPTPLPSLINAMKDESQAMAPNGAPMYQSANGMASPVRVMDLAKQAMDAATEAAEKAQSQIDDWLQECQYHAEVRLQIESSARVGTGILKGPFPKKFKRKAIMRSMDGVGLILKEDIAPISKFIKVWDFYPDPSCGDDIQKGRYVFEHDELTARGLSDLKGLPGYLDDAIEECLDEGPISSETGETAQAENRVRSDKERFDIWYFHGYISPEELEAAGTDCSCAHEQIPALVTMVNNRIIKAAMEPLDSGEFPYDVMVWQHRVGHWAGIGISRQMRTCQRGVNAAARNLMDNAGRSSRPYTVLRRDVVEPGPDEFTYYANEEAEDVSRFMTFFVMDSRQTELMNILQLFMKFAEDVTGLPMLLQGQQGKAPETVGGMTMLNNNANSVLRRIARTFDDRVTERHISRYYEWLLMYGEDDAAKGDFTIDARGSSALIERDMQSQFMQGLLVASLNPAYGVDPVRVMQETLKSQRLDPKRIEYSEEEKQQMASRQPPPPPQVMAAQVREQGATARQQAELQYRSMEGDKDRAFGQWEKQMDAAIESAQLTAEERNVFNKLKTDLARDVIGIRAQKEIAGMKGSGPQVARAPIEPPGRAPNGQAFQL